MIGTSEGAQDVLSSGANSDGVRATGTKGNAENNRSWKVVLEEGDYYVAVQSVDASFIGSKFSESFKFTVASSFKLGDSNGDDTVNILDLTSNVDYILEILLLYLLMRWLMLTEMEILMWQTFLVLLI